MVEKPHELAGRADHGGQRRPSKLTWPNLFEGYLALIGTGFDSGHSW